MKGLIRKDLYLAVKCSRVYMVISLVFLVIGAITEGNAFIRAYPFMMWSMIPATLLSYDEHDRWSSYACCLPYTRAQLVSVKYIMGALGVASIWVLTALTQSIRLGILGKLELLPLLGRLCLLLGGGLLAPAICLPFLFKLGSEKGRLAYMVTMGVFCAASVGIGQMDAVPTVSINPILPVALGLAAYGASWYYSIRVYEKREL